MRRLILAVVLVAAAIAAGTTLWYRSYLDRPLAIPADGYTLLVATGAHWTGIVGQLAADGIVGVPPALVAYGQFTGQAARIKAGEYRLEPGLTPRTLMDVLESGRVILHRLTLVEGWTVPEVLGAVRAAPALARELAADDATGLARELALPWASAEGAFLPETYLFARGDSDRSLLLRAHRALLEQLDAAWAARAPGLPLAGPYELLTLASIVEKETALARERPAIAGVFVRRLERGMRLQTDPTVIYGLGARFDGNLTRNHLVTDNPWNTYTRAGLPPTPIALASTAAIQAAARPAAGDALFFVATGRGDGSHKFSTTLREHEAAVRDYLAALKRRPGE